MFFDPRMLDSLPLVDEERVRSVQRVLVAIATRRLQPLFAAEAEGDPVRIARIFDRLTIERYEDVTDQLRFVSVLGSTSDRWTVLIHERVFDYFAFGLPAGPEPEPASASPEARKVMALAELILRHQLDHTVHPERDEVEIIRADCRFAMYRRSTEPEFYVSLRAALADPTNGLAGGPYLDLFERCEAHRGIERVIRRMVARQLELLAEAPTSLLAGILPTLALTQRETLAANCATRLFDAALPVHDRAQALDNVLAIFEAQRHQDLAGLRTIFDACGARVGMEALLVELGAEKPQGADRDRAFLALLSRLEERRRRRRREEQETHPARRRAEPPPARTTGEHRSLEQRIEAARSDPQVPGSALEVIDANTEGLGGPSKAKYTELIETLLAIPWGRLCPIEVGPRELVAGLEASHSGLERPKELLIDFFTNLIWRTRQLDPEQAADWHRTGSCFLFVGPPGVGKTSLAISVASCLGLPFHKVSLGGMRDEADLRGHGFTYEGSKPGAIVQGLIRMGAMNGMFILDEADKTQPFALATLLEILDPEQNHLFHDRFIQTTVDIDLSNCHFVLTANTLETVPPPVIDRCQVVRLDRYSVEEKVEIARRHILPRLHEQLGLPPAMIDLEPGSEDELLRFLIREYTLEAGVRQLELVLRSLLLRVQRRDLVDAGRDSIRIDRRLIRERLDLPPRPRVANATDRVGEVLGLGVDAERGIGAVIPIQVTRIPGATGDGGTISLLYATGNLERVMDESRKVATTAILCSAEALGVDPDVVGEPVHLHFMGASTRKDGPSAGAAIAVALASLLLDRPVRRDVAITGEVDVHGRLSAIGGLDVKLETAANAGCSTVIIPRDNLLGPDGIEGLPAALKSELEVLDWTGWSEPRESFARDRTMLQVVGVDDIVQAAAIALIDVAELEPIEQAVDRHAHDAATLAAVRMAVESPPGPPTVLVKDPAELECDHFQAGLCRRCTGCRLLVPRGGAAAVQSMAATVGARCEAEEYDPAADGAVRAVERALRTVPEAVVAPFFTLRAAGPHRETERAPLLLASNWTAQGHKPKGAKPVLHRLFCRLLQAGPEAFDSCPLLTEVEGIWVADLERVPEKLRLDPGRAEEILDSLLHRWLEVFERSLEEAPARPPSP